MRDGDALRWRGRGSSSRCYRGASFSDPAADARSANRYRGAPSIRAFILGVRWQNSTASRLIHDDVAEHDAALLTRGET